jgi:tellurite resistance protein
MPSTWAFTFSWAAVASAALRWLQDLRPAGHLAWQYVVLAAITVLIAGIAARTVVAVYRGQLLPAPPAAPPAQPDPVPAPAQSQ